VFDGWLDPKCPGTIWNAAEKLVRDVKVDGLYYWTVAAAAGDPKPHYGRFTILDRPSKIQYTWMSPHTRGLESLLTVTFEAQGPETLL
jgi:Activator of Hsp90 ATPase homolog 1-like protein